ncbi:N-acetyltransferase [Methanosarcina sp. WWM596]|uniref:GNAT family N-acetyltransferase n=1 Tax=Methanosarcina sp. WWM596 TaxID=1434103 RepID=UPI000A89BD67|nr:GNAT family N-acetyltransferase [Methanosarcina sp. WWM596]
MLQTVEEIQDEFATHKFLKAVSKHSIIGSVRTRVMDNTCHIGRLIVHPEWQNLRIGTRLVTEVELMHRDVVRFELFTGSNSIRNLHLYHKLRYQELRREPLDSKVELVYLEKIVIGKKKSIGYKNP